MEFSLRELDFRYADEDDAEDIAVLVWNISTLLSILTIFQDKSIITIRNRRK